MKRDSAINRAALGRVLRVGELYDARKDCSTGVNIFNTVPPDTSVVRQDNPSSRVDFEITDRLSEKFRQLNVDAELQLSVLAKLVKLRGSGNYLSDEKSSERAARMSLLYSVTTQSESINIFDSDLKKIIDLNAIEQAEATHVVVGIEWGANCTVTAEYANRENREQAKVQGVLKAELNKIVSSIDGEGQGNYEETNNKHDSSFSFHSNCDVVTKEERLPSTLQEATKFVQNLPALINQSNNGRGKPLSYTLLPISVVGKYFSLERTYDFVLRSLEEDTILRFVYLFEEISKARRRLNDFYEDIQANSFCISDKALQSVTELRNNFVIAESKAKSELSRVLISVRSENDEVSALDRLMQSIQESEYSPNNTKEYLRSLNRYMEKIKHIEILRNKKIEYFGKSDSLKNLTFQDDEETYVLYYNWEKITKIERENLQLFLSLQKKAYERSQENNRFIVIDCELNRECQQHRATIAHYAKGQLRSENLLKETKADAKVCLALSTDADVCLYPPNNRIPVKLPCPGSLRGGSCKGLDQQWLCLNCRKPLEYGFDNNLYCDCGKANVHSFHYRCNDPNHGTKLLSYPDGSLDGYIERLRPMEELNILILGETGVGKSTWINALANYVVYEDLEEAEKGQLISVISSSFTMTDDNYEETLIQRGEDSNESFEVGKSSTQEPRVYSLQTGDRVIRLIDTPGIGDTRGIDQDKKNMDNILSFLSNYDEIHGICILLKPNNARLDVMFRFCVKELLSHLHKSAAQNIVFCFTNARSTFYKPGDTLPPLKKLLNENPDVEIITSRRTIYCMDNESFRFLAALKNGVDFDKTDRQDYAVSWNRSIEETARLLEHISVLKPHKIKDTLTLNDARRLIVSLSRPIAEISKNIQENITVAEDRRKEIAESSQSISELKGRLYIPKIGLKRRELERPRTVCTSPKCVDVVSVGEDVSQTLYVTHCHPECYLDGVSTDVVNNVALQSCSAMDGANNCRICGCSWNMHMHVTYELDKVQEKVIDENIQNRIDTEHTRKETIEDFIEGVNSRIRLLTEEQQVINRASATFACFLKQNAIAPYNDALVDYLDHLITQEENLVRKGHRNQTLDGLNQMKKGYEEQVKTLENAIARGGETSVITIADVKRLEKELLNLKEAGPMLKEVMRSGSLTKQRIMQYREKRIKTRQARKIDGYVSGFANAVFATANNIIGSAVSNLIDSDKHKDTD